MLVGRFLLLIPLLAAAGSLAAKKKKIPATSGTFPTHGPLFVGLLVGTSLWWGADLLPRALAGSHRGTLPDAAGKTFSAGISRFGVNDGHNFQTPVVPPRQPPGSLLPSKIDRRGRCSTPKSCGGP